MKTIKNKKRILVMLLTISTFITSSLMAQALNNEENESRVFRVGDYIQFGRYYKEPIVWRVIAIEDGKPLIFSDKILTFKSFSTTGDDQNPAGARVNDQINNTGSMFWGDSTLRLWLNSEKDAGKVFENYLYNPPTADRVIKNHYSTETNINPYDQEAGFLSNFTQSEIAEIAPRTHKVVLLPIDDIDEIREGGIGSYDYLDYIRENEIMNVINPKADENLQGYDTASYYMSTDKLFLLSKNEIEEYLPNFQDRIATATIEALENSNTKISINPRTQGIIYWLRTAAYIINYQGSLNYGHMDAPPPPASGEVGVRPALLLKSISNYSTGTGSKDDPYVVLGNEVNNKVQKDTSISTDIVASNPDDKFSIQILNIEIENILEIEEYIIQNPSSKDIIEKTLNAILSTKETIQNYDGQIQELYVAAKRLAENAIKSQSTITLEGETEEDIVRAQISDKTLEDLMQTMKSNLVSSERLNKPLKESNLGIKINPFLNLVITSEKESVKRSIVNIPKIVLSEVQKNNINNISLKTPIIEIKVDLNNIKEATSDIVIDVRKVDKGEFIQLQNNDAQGYEIKIESDSTKFQNFSKELQIKIPYELKEGENSDNLTVYYLDQTGKTVNEIGFYDQRNKTINFKTNHLSVFFISANPIVFRDNTDSWAAGMINAMASKGVIKGLENNTYDPKSNVTRAEFITMITNAFKLPIAEYKNNFKDVNPDDWYANFVATALQNNIVSGYEDSTFKPKNKISRQEMVTIISNIMIRFMDIQPIENTRILESNFKDYTDINDFATQAVATTYRYGIVSGMPSGNFNPTGSTTRAEAAVVIYKLLNMKYSNW
jgi:hypothetical protein